MDWFEWHRGYQGGGLSDRLKIVQDQLTQAITATRPGPIKIISVCVGQGHDVVGVAAASPRRADIRALLVEADGRNVAEARRRVEASGLDGIEVRHADAGATDAYTSAGPAQIVLLCGVFGSLTDADVDATVAVLPQLCDERARVIWTSHRETPGLHPLVEAAFGDHGFVREWTDPADRFGVTRHRMITAPAPFWAGQRLFTFADEQTLIDLGRTKGA